MPKKIIKHKKVIVLRVWYPNVENIYPTSSLMMETLSFSDALILLKNGRKVARSGWNGKGMYITLKPGYTDGVNVYSPYLEMKTADNNLVPWLASQTDLLTTDWMIVEQ